MSKMENKADFERMKKQSDQINSVILWKLTRKLKAIFEVFVKLFFFVKFFSSLLLTIIFRAIIKIYFVKKLLKYFKLKYPNLAKKYTKNYNGIAGNLSIFTLLSQYPLLMKLAKKVYFKFPRFSKFLLKFFKIINGHHLDLDFALKFRRNAELQDEINDFLNDLKLQIAGKNSK